MRSQPDQRRGQHAETHEDVDQLPNIHLAQAHEQLGVFRLGQREIQRPLAHIFD